MAISLRYRLLLTLAPLLALLAGLGIAAIGLLQQLGGRVDAILRENYDSVRAIQRLNEALERIDSSFQFALAAQETKAREQYQANWPEYLAGLHQEQANITLPGEAEAVAQLSAWTDRYRRLGDAFYAQPAGAGRSQAYFGPGGLLDAFKEIKQSAGAILQMNQDNMEAESRAARRTARLSIVGFSIGLGITALAALGIAWRTARVLLDPIRRVTESAQAIGAGNLDQLVPVLSRDELGLLAESFNVMARQLRHYRQTSFSQLLRAQRTSQATIDSFLDPVLVVDADGRVVMANPSAQRLLGVVPAASNGPDGAIWQPPEPLREPLQNAIRAQKAYLPDGFDHAVALGTGSEPHSYLPRFYPIRDPYGNSLGAAVLLQDVTRFRLLDQVKSNLVATASHELKTPLTSIRLAVHLLLEESVGPLTATQADLLLDARANAERLLDMVNNLLDLARLERGEQGLERRPEDPGELLRTAADLVLSRAGDQGIEMVFELSPGLPTVPVDRVRLGYALQNLLDNALAFTDRGGRITLGARPADRGIEWSIADTGCGIPAEYLPHVFDKFLRIPGHSPESGTGLGLAISREIVTAHGGTIRCESTPGKGTTFRIWLPTLQGSDQESRRLGSS